MKDALTNYDVHVLARELAPKRFSKIVRISGGYKIKLVGAPDLLYLPPLLIPTQYVISADRPDNLAIISRKRLGNRRITSVSQLNFDRILRFDTEDGSIVLELFGDGNVILTNADGVITYALHERDWRDRSVRRGVLYTPPPAPHINPSISYDEFAQIFTAKDAVRSLVRAGVPPVFAEDVCASAGVDKQTPVHDLTGDQIRALYDALLDQFTRLEHPDPVVVRQGSEVVDILPFPVAKYSDGDYELDHYSTLSEALDVLTPTLVSIAAQPEPDEERDMVSFWKKQRDDAARELAELESMLNEAYTHSNELLTAMSAAKSGAQPPQSFGPFRLKRWDGREVVYEFTPQP
ncbi:MAG: hypothetical protein GXN93_01505 [Candidatus Diapherotrites archaeon]|nr:hypothetical protein [Candidatus Diapherotrites archaeon]